MQSRAAWEVLGCVLGTLNQSVTECKFVAPTHSDTKQAELSELGAEKGLLQNDARKQTVCAPPPKPKFLEGFQQTVFKCKVRDGDCCKLLGAGILCSCPCPHKAGQDIPVNLQQDRCCSLVCNLISLYKWKSVFRALRMGSPVYFRQHS